MLAAQPPTGLRMSNSAKIIMSVQRNCNYYVNWNGPRKNAISCRGAPPTRESICDIDFFSTCDTWHSERSPDSPRLPLFDLGSSYRRQRPTKDQIDRQQTRPVAQTQQPHFGVCSRCSDVNSAVYRREARLQNEGQQGTLRLLRKLLDTAFRLCLSRRPTFKWRFSTSAFDTRSQSCTATLR